MVVPTGATAHCWERDSFSVYAAPDQPHHSRRTRPGSTVRDATTFCRLGKTGAELLDGWPAAWEDGVARMSTTGAAVVAGSSTRGAAARTVIRGSGRPLGGRAAGPRPTVSGTHTQAEIRYSAATYATRTGSCQPSERLVDSGGFWKG